MMIRTLSLAFTLLAASPAFAEEKKVHLDAPFYLRRKRLQPGSGLPILHASRPSLSSLRRSRNGTGLFVTGEKNRA